MFFVTAVFRCANAYLVSYATREAPYSLFHHLTKIEAFKWYLGYMFEGETILALIASPILYFGRKDNIIGKIFRILPLCYLVFEFIAFFIQIFTLHQMLAPVILDLLCIAAYLLFLKSGKIKEKQQ